MIESVEMEVPVLDIAGLDMIDGWTMMD